MPGRLRLHRFRHREGIGVVYITETGSLGAEKIQLPLVLLCYNLLDSRGDGR